MAQKESNYLWAGSFKLFTAVINSILQYIKEFGSVSQACTSLIYGVKAGAWRHDTQRNDTQRNDTQRNDTQRNDTLRNDTHRNDIQGNDKLNAILSIMTLSIMTLSIMTQCCYAESFKLSHLC